MIIEVRGKEKDVNPPFIHLNHMILLRVPNELLHPSMKNVLRLDLGWNDIRTLPSGLCKVMTKLQELWLNSNPLQAIPQEIENLQDLKVLDLHDTELVKLPRETGRLQKIVTLDLRNIPTLKQKLKEAYASGETAGVLKYLRNKDIKKELKIELEGRFKEGVYREVSDSPEGCEKIRLLTKAVFQEFTEFELIKNIIRNCERLFPEDIEKANVSRVKKNFFALRRQNEMKKLAAELELKLRRIYFDQIQPSSVENIVKSIYLEIKTLKDIQFLIKHAKVLFPKTPEEIVASKVKDRLVELQERLAAERASAIRMVEKALRSVYPHVEPKDVRMLTESVCERFSRVEDLKKLAAD